MHAVAVDVIWFPDITDVYIGNEKYDFVISRKDDRIYLSSPSREDIIKVSHFS